MNARTGFNNPLYDDTLADNPTKKQSKPNSKHKPSAITFYDTQVSSSPSYYGAKVWTDYTPS